MPTAPSQQVGWKVVMLVRSSGDPRHFAGVTVNLNEIQPAVPIELTIPNTGVPAMMNLPSSVELSLGWNLVSLPFSPTVPFRVSDLVESMRRDGVPVAQVTRWQTGAWQSSIPGFDAEDYDLEFGRGYFVRTIGPGVWRARPSSE